MSKQRYVLIHSREGDNPVSWLEDGEVDDIPTLMEDYSVRQFLGAVPLNDDPNYWDEGDALLLEVRVVTVRPKETVTAWTIE